MIKRVLIIGGYGNFGTFISRMLAREKNIQLIISGRNIKKAKSFSDTLNATNNPEAAFVDINNNLFEALSKIKPEIVIHTSGPYQGQDYIVAQTCINYGCHYIDLADAREFVAEIDQLNGSAKKKDVLICSGASSVPCFTAAIIDKYIEEFEQLREIEYGIATAQLTNRGLATTSAVLSYAGKPFTTLIDGKMQNVYGWLDLNRRKYWNLGSRFLGNCDIPDLSLFPKRYPSLKTIRFRAGLELKILHINLVLLSLMVKMGVLKSLQPFSSLLLKLSFMFDPFGNDNSGFYMKLVGNKNQDKNKVIIFELVAKNGDGLYIPSMPAILLTKKLAQNKIKETGAKPCIDLISLDEYLDGLKEFNINWRVIQ